ncbi:hypothetical protein C8Q72DRAFT_804086 [Fomitopsis betulina]|nr:hypothetical protein C8Q72DRAFT_804086 [Fomitopsis betulina]
MAAQFPGVSCAPTPGDDLLWGNASLFPEEPVDIDSWSSLMGIPPSLTAAGHAVNRVPDPAELWQGPYDSMRASIEATFQTYSSFSNSSPGTSSPASDWTAIFSPAASMCSPETVPTASSSALPSPEPTMITPSPLASRNRRDRKATPHGGRVRSSASRAAKQSPIIPSFASVRTTAPRNKQIPVDEVRDPVCRGDTWFCSNCPYQSRRKGDLRRHVRSHSDDTGYYVCCGVPVEDAPGHVGDIRFHEGREMVGGCDKAFKRKDSLLRHLKASNGVCIRPVYL